MSSTIRRHPWILLPAALAGLLAAILLVLSPWQAAADQPVDMSIVDPANGNTNKTVGLTDTFTLSARIFADGGTNQIVDAAQIYIDFDATVFQVDGGTSGVTLNLPNNWFTLAATVVDNTAGQIDVSVGPIPGLGTSIISQVDLVDIDFVANAGSTGSDIEFSTTGQRATALAEGLSNNVTGTLTDATIIVSGGALPPNADAGPNQTVDEGDTVDLTGIGSTDDGNIVSYAWTQISGPTIVIQNATTSTPSFLAVDDGAYIIQLEVTDNDAQTDTDTVIITANNVAPIVTADNATGPEGAGTITLDFDIDDPGLLDQAAGFTVDIDWDDGNVETINGAAQGPNTIDHEYAQDGPYNVTVQATDDDESGQDTAVVTVTNVAPLVTAAADPGAIPEGTLLDLSPDPIATFTDPGTLDVHTATIDWDDGNVDNCPADCTVTEPSSDGEIAGSHVYGDDGSFTVTVTVSDELDSGSDTLLVTVTNVAPTLSGLTGDTIVEGGTATVSGNIADPGADDTFTVEIDWDDPNDPGAVSVPYQISTDTFATIDRNIGFAVLSNLGDGLQSDTLSNMGGADLDAATLYEWRVRARSVAGLTGDYSTTASFVTEGNPVAVTLEVDLEAPGTADDPVEFTVKLYAKDAFNPTSSTPWDLFGEIPVVPEFAGITGSRAGQTITITLPDTVAVGFYDITIQANHTLVNVKDNVGVATNTGTIVMGTLLEGNAIDDDPATEPGSVINALDASLLAVAINEGTDDPAVDFTRNGTVDLDDLDLLKANYLRFSPIPV